MEDRTVSKGETVQNLKKWLKDNREVPYGAITLLFNDKPMVDPLSLNDFEEIKSKSEVEIFIKVINKIYIFRFVDD